MSPPRYAVTLEWVDGPTRTVDVAPDETVLEAAERADAPLPYGCRTGACSTCVGRVLSIERARTASGTDAGEATGSDGTRGGDGRTAGSDADGDGPIDVGDGFAYRREPRALKPGHRDDGYVLLCIATPRANSRVAVGSRVQTELVDNPWK